MADGEASKGSLRNSGKLLCGSGGVEKDLLSGFFGEKKIKSREEMREKRE
jgi:hypothetical protein